MASKILKQFGDEKSHFVALSAKPFLYNKQKNAYFFMHGLANFKEQK